MGAAGEIAARERLGEGLAEIKNRIEEGEGGAEDRLAIDPQVPLVGPEARVVAVHGLDDEQLEGDHDRAVRLQAAKRQVGRAAAEEAPQEAPPANRGHSGE